MAVVSRLSLGAWALGLSLGISLAGSAAAQEPEPDPEQAPGSDAEPGEPGAEPPAEEAPAEEAPAEGGAPMRDVVMPELEHFEQAPYPPEAEAAGLQAEVILELDIDATGAVLQARSVQPVGHGFDEAAERAALKFRWKPALVKGVPAPVRIKYLYRFTLSPPEPAAEEEAPPELPTTGNLGGFVLIGDKDAPLVAAEVTITDPEGGVQTVFTDETGAWLFEGLPPARYTVKISAPGFYPLEVQENVVANEAVDATYRLTAETEGYEIVVRGERPPREVTRRTIERREMSRIPGTNGDALRSIQSLPGVARSPGFAGLLIVRGSAPQSTAIFVDGSDVPLIYHFGGLSSAVPTELLDRIDFYPGNFSARYGRVMGGVVDAALRDPNTTCNAAYGKPTDEKGCYHGMAQVDLIDARTLVQGPIGRNWSFAIAGRRSWIDTWLKPVLQAAGAGVTSAPVYYDYQTILTGEFDDGSTLSFRFFGSDDKMELLINDPAAQDPGILGGNLNFGTSFYRGQVLYNVPLTKNVELRNMLSVGSNRAQFSLAQIKFDLKQYPVALRNEFAIKAMDGLKIYAGQDVQTGPYDVLVRAPAPPRPGEPDGGPFSTRPLFETKTNGTVYRPAWYVEADARPTQRTQIVPGFRADFARDTGHADFSPRVNARYDLFGGAAEADWGDEKRLRTTLKGGVGYFYQPPQYQETDPVFGKPGIYSNKSIHYTVGFEQELTEQIQVGWEGYYKDLTNVVSREPDLTGLGSYGNKGVGHVIGMETSLKYKPDKRFFGWLAYTLSRSVRQDLPGQPEHLFQYDQTHNMTALGSYRLGGGWEFGARFRVISGPLVTPAQSAPNLASLYASDAATYTPIQAPPFSRRMPLVHKLDVRIDKAWQFEDWRLAAYLDIQNVYNNAAVESLSYNYDYTKAVYGPGLPILPSVGLRGEF